MKFFCQLLLVIIFYQHSVGQDSLWQPKLINPILKLSLPTKFNYAESSFIKAYAGEINGNYYLLQYYDTVFKSIESQKSFSISLQGFMSGRSDDPELKTYDGIIVDTTLGGAKGLFGSFLTSDASKNYARIYYFATIANNQYYWFCAYSTFTNYNSEIDFFFKSIKFKTEAIKEKEFQLLQTRLIKKRG